MVEQAKRTVGRPRLFETPEQFETKVYEYQKHCKDTDEPVTWTGLALFLGFSSRQSIDEYANYEGFSDSVKKAKTFVEYHYELRLNGDRPTGAIFALKNMGWADKTEVHQTTESTTKVTADMTPQEAAQAYQDLMNGG